MENFNNMLDMIKKNKGTELAPDTDTDTGSFGNASGDGMEAEAPQEEKLIIRLEGGVEIHLPTAVYDALSVAMNGAPESDEVMPCGGGGPEMDTEEADEEDKKECPFAKDESEESSTEEKADESEDESEEEEDKEKE